MLSILNRYMHGYVVIPITITFIKHGIFKEISLSNSIAEIILQTQANSGNFKIALRMYESLGWINLISFERYELTSTCPDFSCLSPKLARSYQVPLESYLGNGLDSVDKYLDDIDFINVIKLLPDCRSRETDYFSYLLSSSVLLPILYLFKHKIMHRGQELCLDGISEIYKKEISNFFYKTGITNETNGKVVFSDLGDVLWESIKNCGVTLSYRPILSQTDELIFGDVKTVFSTLKKEEHVDRELNVVGSGAQHELFFKDMIEYIQAFLGKENIGEIQIVDMGCGDGSFLRKCYESLNAQVRESKKIDLIGIDLNEEALDVAKKTLKNIPHFLFAGNINNPTEVLKNLVKEGYSKDDLLHTRAFLDHNCPLNPQSDLSSLHHNAEDDTILIPSGDKISYSKEGRISGTSPDETYSCNKGDEISGEWIGKNLVKNFERWSQIVGHKGLLTLEVFSLSPSTIRKYLDETESLHFDTLHGLSQQYLVKANTYLISAARVGLLPRKSSFKKYPRVLPYTRISLQHFFKKSFQIRNASHSDLNALYELENITLPSNLCATKEQIERRISQYPEGNYVVEKDKNIVGVLYTQRIEKESSLYQMAYETVEQFHQDEGKICQLLSVQISPLDQGSGLARELLSFVILHNFVREGIKKVVGISRCACYDSSKGDYTEYIHGKNKLGYALDPILRIHQEEGAKIINLVDNYRKNDDQNLGFGVHIAYDYLSWSQK